MSARDFWSRRRAAVAREAEAEHAALRAQEAEQAEAALATRDDADILAQLNLPEPEALDSPDAVRAFLQAAVPQRLKTRALRRLWRLNPVLANLDGLVDYDDDYTDAATVVKDLKTAYQVGKGILREVEARTADPAPEVDDETDDAADMIAAAEVNAAAPTLSAAPALSPAPAPQDAPAPPHAAPRRRMIFQFEANA